MGVPLCLSSAVPEKTEQEKVIYGDDSGAAIMLQSGSRDLPARVLKPGDFTYVHDDHTDWVTQVSSKLVIVLYVISGLTIYCEQLNHPSDTVSNSCKRLSCTCKCNVWDS